MDNIMENLFNKYSLGDRRYIEEQQRIATNEGMIKKKMNKWQKNRLRNIIDDNELMAEKWAADSFREGVRFGVKFMIEVFNDIQEFYG